MERPERVASESGWEEEGPDEEIPPLMASSGYLAERVGRSVSSCPPPTDDAVGGPAAADGHGRDPRRDRAAQEQMQATSLMRDIEVEEITLRKLEIESKQRELSMYALQSTATELDKRKADLLSKIQIMHHESKNVGPRDAGHRLMSVLDLLKDLEKQESDFQSSFKQNYDSMEVGIVELEKGIYNGDSNKVDDVILDRSIIDAQEKLNSAKKELGAKLRAILSLKRQIDDFPSQTELIQYELRFSELHVQIQERLRQTRKHYDTYNALLDIKELMLKEISLLNSISSQFQEAIVDTAGRSKLMDSMEAVAKGTQQKLKKVEIAFHSEQKTRDSLKEKYHTMLSEQRHFSSLLKAFQEERAKQESFRSMAAI